MIPIIETQTTAEITALQNQLLQKQIAYLMEKSPFYQQKFKEENIKLGTIQTINDLKKVSVTTKNDLQLYNDDFFLFFIL